MTTARPVNIYTLVLISMMVMCDCGVIVGYDRRTSEPSSASLHIKRDSYDKEMEPLNLQSWW